MQKLKKMELTDQCIGCLKRKSKRMDQWKEKNGKILVDTLVTGETTVKKASASFI